MTHDPVGLTGMQREGSTYRPMTFDRWRVPSDVQLEKRAEVLGIRWTAGKRLLSSDPRFERRVFDDFIALVGVGDQAANVLEYATRYGTLTLCRQHLQPISHSRALLWTAEPRPPSYRVRPPGPSAKLLQLATPAEIPDGLPGHQLSSWEPVPLWVQWAQKFEATMAVASHMHRGRLGPVDPWVTLLGGGEFWDDPISWHKGADLEDAWNVIAHWLDTLLLLSGIRWTFRLDQEGGGRLAFRGGALFGVLVAQLALAVARAEAFTFCDGCQRIFAPKTPRGGSRRAFCPECRENNVPNRLAQQRSRAAKRGAADP